MSSYLLVAKTALIKTPEGPFETLHLNGVAVSSIKTNNIEVYIRNKKYWLPNNKKIRYMNAKLEVINDDNFPECSDTEELTDNEDEI